MRNLRQINLKKPTPFYKSLRHYASEIRRWGKSDAGPYPCYYCNGWGKTLDPNDCDPIEGYKLAHRRVTCPVCQGKGNLSKAVFTACYQQNVDKWKQDLKQWEAEVRVLRSAFAKLTKEEMEAIAKNLDRSRW
jgi:hypothetical protein